MTELDLIKEATADAIKLIAVATETALKPLATSAENAVHAIAVAAADALKVANVQSDKDHDAIITLIADFKNLEKSQANFQLEVKQSFIDLKDNYSEKINNNKTEIGKHDERISSLEESRAEVRGKVSTSTVIVGYIFTAIGLLLAIYLSLQK